MGLSIGGVSASNALRRSWRDAHAPANGEVILGSLGPPVNAVIVQAEPAVGFAQPTVTGVGFEQPNLAVGSFMPTAAVATAVGVRQA